MKQKERVLRTLAEKGIIAKIKGFFKRKAKAPTIAKTLKVI